MQTKVLLMKLVAGQRDDRRTLSAQIVSNLTQTLDGTEQSRDDYAGGDCYIQWGFKLTRGLQYALDNKIPYIILDWGYFNNGEGAFSVSFNGFHGLSMPVDAIEGKAAREHPRPEPWQDGGNFVYVYGQLQNDRAVRGLHVSPWMTTTAQLASKIFELPAKIRPHPKMLSSWESSLEPLSETFEETYVAVSYTSSAAIQSVLAGVPTVAIHPASPAFMVCASGLAIFKPAYRMEWLFDLSWRNYRLTEIEEAATYVKLGLKQATKAASLGRVDTEGLRV